MRVPLALLVVLTAAQEPPKPKPIPLDLGENVLTLAFAPDGSAVYGGGGGLIGHRNVTVIRAWDPVTGKLLRELRGQELPVASVAVSPDGTLVASAPYSDVMVNAIDVHLWDAASGKLIAKLAGHEGSINSVAFSADGARLVSGGSFDATVRIWDVAGRKQIASWRTPVSGICTVLFLPDGKSVVYGSGDGVIRVLDAATGKETGAGRAHRRGVNCVSLSADGRLVASVGGDGLLRVADTASLGEGVTVEHGKTVRHAEFSPDGRFLASSADDGLRLFETATMKEVLRIDKAFGPVAFSRDGRRIATGAMLLNGFVWDLAALAAADAVPEAYRAAWKRIGQGDAAVAELKSRLLSTPSADAIARAFTRLDDDDARVRESAFQELLGTGPAIEGEVKVKLLGNPPESLKQPLEDLRRRMNGPVADSPYLLERSRGCFVLETIGTAAAIEVLEELSRSGKSAIERADAAASVQRLKARANHLIAAQEETPVVAPVLHLKNDGKPVRSLAFSPDGRSVFSAGGHPRVWSLEGGRERLRIAEGWGDEVWSAAFSEDGRTIAACELAQDVIEIWDGATGAAEILVFPGGRVGALALAPDASFVVSSALGVARHDLRNFARAPMRYDDSPEDVLDLALSGDGKMLAASSADRSVHLWDAATGRPLRVLRNDDLAGERIRFLGRSNLLLAAGRDEKLAVIWDAAAGRILCRLDGFANPLVDVSVSADGRRLATLEENGTLLLWELASARPILRAAKGLANASSVAISPDGSHLAAGTDDGDLQVWATDPGATLPDDLDRRWVLLGDNDPAKASATAAALRRAGAGSVEFLRSRLLEPVAPDQIASALAGLEDPDAKVRDKARQALEGMLHDPAVWTSLEKSTSPEVALWTREIVRDRGRLPVRSPEALRRIRAIAVLEALGAGNALEAVSKAAENSLTSFEARAALERLRARPKR